MLKINYLSATNTQGPRLIVRLADNRDAERFACKVSKVYARRYDCESNQQALEAARDFCQQSPQLKAWLEAGKLRFINASDFSLGWLVTFDSRIEQL